MQKSVSLILSAIFCFSLSANQAEVLKKLVEKESESEQKKEKYEGDSLVYNLYDLTRNGIKGGILAGTVTGVLSLAVLLSERPALLVLGIIPAVYFDAMAADLLAEKLILTTSNAKQFGSKSRKELEKEMALRELINRLAKAAVSTGIVARIILPRLSEQKNIFMNEPYYFSLIIGQIFSFKKK